MISEEKKLQILRLFQDDESIKEIVRQTGNARNTVRKVIRNVKPKKVGRPRALSDRTVRQIKHYIIASVKRGKRVTSSTIKNDYNLAASRPTIRRTLSANGASYNSVEKILPLKHSHKVGRLSFALRHLELETDFETWIFTDEKRFSLDGPDSFGSYGVGEARLQRIKHQQSGGGVMVFGAICSNGKMMIKVVPNQLRMKF